jgi:hypothetical protein
MLRLRNNSDQQPQAATNSAHTGMLRSRFAAKLTP